MGKQMLFVQGAGEGAHDQWDDKLVESLERELGEGYAVRYPRMPDEGDPKYSAWKAALGGELDSLEEGAVLVGHSVGGTILIHTLAERPPSARLGGLFFIAAPFIGEGGWPSDEIKPRADLSARLPAGLPIFFYHGLRTRSYPWLMFSCTRRRCRTPWCAPTSETIISSTMICARSRGISAHSPDAG